MTNVVGGDVCWGGQRRWRVNNCLFHCILSFLSIRNISIIGKSDKEYLTQYKKHIYKLYFK